MDMIRRFNKIKCLLSTFLFGHHYYLCHFNIITENNFPIERRGVKSGPHPRCATTFHFHHFVLYCIRVAAGDGDVAWAELSLSQKRGA